MNKKLYKDAERMLENEIRDTVDSGSLDMQKLDTMYKVLDNLKDISIICAMKKELEDNEYSERSYYDDESYARGRGRSSRRRSYEGSYDDYSRMMSEAQSEKERDLIRQLMEARNN